MLSKVSKGSLFSLTAIAALSLGACNSSDPGQSGESGKDEQFVSTESSVGGIRLNVVSNRVPVGDSTGFTVSAFDASGAAVPATRIACDTEGALALIEPTSGFELTDSSGSMSGRVGCEGPGSFQIACRLPIGANKRQFETVVCEGSAPVGFAGFEGAGGGGLGGGVDTSDSEGDTAFALRVVGISFFDTGSTESGDATTSIDITQDLCDNGEDDPTAEPFFDSSISFDIENNSGEAVVIESYTYTVANFNGSGGSHTSGRLAFLGEAPTVEAGGGTKTVSALFADAEAGGKRFFGRSDNISSEGFKNITFNIRGTTASGETVNFSGSSSASFDNFNRCE